MAKNNDRLKHGLHNEEVCSYLSLRNEFTDWTITTAFYASLHFVSFKIFPFNAPAPGSKTTSIENIDHYFNYDNPKRISKHDLLGNLVFKICPAISEDYDWLLDMSMNARYKFYSNDKEVADKAIRLMKAIKKECISAKDLASL